MLFETFDMLLQKFLALVATLGSNIIQKVFHRDL